MQSFKCYTWQHRLVVPVQTIKAYKGSSRAPLILSFGTRKTVVKSTPLPLHFRRTGSWVARIASLDVSKKRNIS